MTKLKIVLAVAFSCCILFGVGFADWAIFEDNPSWNSEIEGGAESVLFSDDYIKLDDDGVTWFDYTYRGFRHGDEIDYNGSLTAEYILNLRECRNIYSAGETLTVEFSIALKNHAKYDVFAEGGFVTADVRAEGVQITYDRDRDIKFDNNSMLVSMELTLGSSEDVEAKIVVTYDFNFEKSIDYSNYIYNQFGVADQGFKFDAKLMEKGV